MNKIVHCPKCRKVNHVVECRHLASDAWECPRCDFEFQLNIMPEPMTEWPCEAPVMGKIDLMVSCGTFPGITVGELEFIELTDLDE